MLSPRTGAFRPSPSGQLETRRRYPRLASLVMMIERRAARALLIAGDSVLLIRGCDPARPELGDWWLTPGGGIEDGESFAVAVAREVREETGLDLPPDRFGACVATRVAEFDFDGQAFHQRE